MLEVPECYNRDCVHYLGVLQPNDSEIGERPYCTAYPSGIPDDIAYGDDKHLQARDDQDNDIVYEESE